MTTFPSPSEWFGGDAEKTKFVWGARALPWLILTDWNHVISAEGFELDELYKKIEAVAEK